MNYSFRLSGVLLILVALMFGSGCTTTQLTMQANTEGGNKIYQHFSAGYTGCMPDKNLIEVIEVDGLGEVIWTATCEDKVYLCSGVIWYHSGYSLSCAPKVM